MIFSVAWYYGQSMTGKTCRMLHDLSGEDRVIVLDAKCQELTGLEKWSHLWPVYDVDCAAWADSVLVDALRAARVRDDYYTARPLRLVVHFRANHRENLDLLCRLLPHVRDCVLAVDELALFLPPGALAPAVTSVLISGRHEGIRLAGTAQRPSLVNITARSAAQRLSIFRMIEPTDVDAVRNVLPVDLRDSVPVLPSQVSIEWAEGFGAFVDWSFRGKLGSVLPAYNAT